MVVKYSVERVNKSNYFQLIESESLKYMVSLDYELVRTDGKNKSVIGRFQYRDDAMQALLLVQTPEEPNKLKNCIRCGRCGDKTKFSNGSYDILLCELCLIECTKDETRVQGANS